MASVANCPCEVHVIDIKNFSKCYVGHSGEGSTAVKNLSFQVQPGQILGLVGRNGAGKTTTLRSINGIIPATEGEISISGYSLLNDPIEVKRRTAYVPDDPQLFEDLSVEQHLQFQASVYRIPSPAKTIAELLELFELEDKRHQRADSLSRGMRQKLAICCAYLQNPDALLLDEPMTGLDPQAIRALKSSVIQKASEGAAVIISSHLLAMVEKICSHILVLDRGQCKFHGTVEAFHHRFNSSEQRDASSLEDAFFLSLNQVSDAVSEELIGAPIQKSASSHQTHSTTSGNV